MKKVTFKDFLIVLLAVLMKMTSPIFNDGRGKLGNTVVGSSWRGRWYLRSYCVPNNPKTNAQTAHRLTMSNIVDAWQTRAATPANKTSWNAIGTPYQLPGYNMYTKYGRGSYIEAVTGGESQTIDVTGYTNIPLDKAHFYAYATVAETWTDEGAVPTATFTDLALEMPAGEIEYTIWIGHSDAENDPVDGNAACTCWYPDEATGLSDVATADSAAV